MPSRPTRIAQAREKSIELLREGGVLKQMTKAVLERELAEELADHRGYEVGDPAGTHEPMIVAKARGIEDVLVVVAA